VLASLLMALVQPAFAEVYRWVDDQGNVEFSDEPRAGSEKVEIGPTTTITLPKLAPEQPAASASTDQPAAATTSYSRLDIVYPENNSAFNSGNGDVSVTMVVDPPLRPNHSLRLTMDGTKTITTKENHYTFNNVDRGTHQLQLDIIDNTSIVMEGPSISFTVHRPSVILNN